MRKISLSLFTTATIDNLNKKTPLEVFNNQLMEAMRYLNSSKINYSFTTTTIPKRKRK